eukprot:TRINITY_DN6718_c0_g1_i3.p1 TRINITY_DN6718_c0_g1~~TRINITY_DN6718_c0_g1_i3.p1  ORF type:complete len:354 (-),score=54.77 TRINITY_DN6718_c0_g1_i3:290-1351(-)
MQNRVSEYTPAAKAALLYIENSSLTRTIALCSGTHDVLLFNPKSNQFEFRLKGHEHTPLCVRFHPSNPRILASLGRDGFIILWSLDSGRILLKRYFQGAFSIVFHPHHHTLIVGTTHGVDLWHWELQLERYDEAHPEDILDLYINRLVVDVRVLYVDINPQGSLFTYSLLPPAGTQDKQGKELKNQLHVRKYPERLNEHPNQDPTTSLFHVDDAIISAHHAQFCPSGKVLYVLRDGHKVVAYSCYEHSSGDILHEVILHDMGSFTSLCISPCGYYLHVVGTLSPQPPSIPTCKGYILSRDLGIIADYNAPITANDSTFDSAKELTVWISSPNGTLFVLSPSSRRNVKPKSVLK